MRTHRLGKWLLIANALVLVAACQPSHARPAPPAAVTPLAMFEVTSEAEPVSMSAPELKTPSGVYLTAQISPVCAGTVPPDTDCVQPYLGEFMITALNGAVVTSVMTNNEGQATIELPPGKYILGVKTENIYPLAAPVKVNVLADRYTHILLDLDSGLRARPLRQ